MIATMYRNPPSSPRFFRWYVEQLKFTLLAAATMIVPIAVSVTAASYCVAIFNIGGAIFNAIERILFFGILIAEALAYCKFQQWRLSRGKQ
jgi:hypothetical protein